jgi:hypothetical protein
MLVAHVVNDLHNSFRLWEWIHRLPAWDEADLKILKKLKSGFAMKKNRYKLGKEGVKFELMEIEKGGVSSNWRFVMFAVYALVKCVLR